MWLIQQYRQFYSLFKGKELEIEIYGFVDRSEYPQICSDFVYSCQNNHLSILTAIHLLLNKRCRIVFIAYFSPIKRCCDFSIA